MKFAASPPPPVHVGGGLEAAWSPPRLPSVEMLQRKEGINV